MTRLSILLALSLALVPGCTCGGKDDKADELKSAPIGEALISQEQAPDGLNMRLSEGKLAGRAGSRNKIAAARTLSADITAKLLARLPAFGREDGDQKSFAMRPSSKPAPRPGETIKGVFPAPPRPAPTSADDSAALEVIRHSPEGDVPLAPHLSVTFSQPMVAVTSHADNLQNNPVRLTPQPKGQWRWVGTKTILFDPDVRFPQATHYSVEVAAGTRGSQGKAMAAAKQWTFSTPALTVKSVYPSHGPQELDPVIAIQFDQRIDAATLLSHVYLEYGGNMHPLRLATTAEIATDNSIKTMVELAGKEETRDRLLVVKPKASLPKATSVSVVVRKGAPSAEGPRLTESDQTNSFSTYGPLTIVQSRCDWGNRCPPRSGWQIEMTNPIDPEVFDPAAFKIEPALKGRALRAAGRYIQIRGLPTGNTKYKVTVPSQLTDKFGQTLGSDQVREFDVGPATPQLSGPSGLVVLDPYAKKPTLNVFSINQKKLKVEIRKVSPSDWDAFAEYMYRWRDKTPPPLPGRRVFSGEVDTTPGDEELVETPIDLSSALSGGLGHAVVIVTPTTWPNNYAPHVQTWVQATGLGLDGAVDGTTFHAFASELKTGKPAAGVGLTLVPADVKAETKSDGTATLKLAASPRTDVRHMLLARRGDDVAFLPDQLSWWRSAGLWFPRSGGKTLRWMVFDDRTMYRPGEKVHIKGWVRERGNDLGGDIGRAEGLESVSYVVRGPRGNEITKGESKINAAAGFDLSFDIPTTPNLGQASVELTSGARAGSRHVHSFQIQEFRRPEYEVTAEVSPGPHTIGSKASVTATAKYYSGGGLAAAPVTWSVNASPASFRPPGHDKFTYGDWTPWWSSPTTNNAASNMTLTGTTTSSGQHVLDIDFLSAKPPRPMSVVATARVSDVNRQAWAASATLLVHPSELYVGIRRDKYFIERGEPVEFDMIVTDQDGKIATDIDIAAKLVRLDWKWKNGRYSEVEADEKLCQKRSAAEPVHCSLPAPAGGTYKITATVVDAAGRPNQTSVRTWVTGGKRPPARNVELEKVELIPDQEEYKPGDKARLLVRAPFEDAEGVLTIRRSGIVSSERFTFAGTTHVIEVPIRDGDTPNLHVQVEVVGKAPRLDAAGKPSTTLPPRPAFGSGSISLKIPPAHRTLAIAVSPTATKLEPGGETTVAVEVKDARGKPVAGAEVALIVVDESVLALSGKITPDPVAAFYGYRDAGASDYRSRMYVKLARPDVATFDGQPPPADDADMADGEESAAEMPASPAPVAADEGKMGKKDGYGTGSGRGRGQYAMKSKKESPGGLRRDVAQAGLLGAISATGATKNRPTTPIAVRSNFNALATFAPAEKTDASGVVRVAVKLPDNLTRYRVMAVAVDAERQFGSAESAITARMPLMVRPSPPRFLNFGDELELPIVVQNQTDKPLEVEVAIRSANAMLTAGAGRALTVPANDRVEVRFPTRAMLPGTARFQVGVSAGKWADAKTFELPVWTPATTEAFATYGTVGDDDDKGVVAQPVKRPTDVVEEFGGLEITTSSTQLSALTDAVLYLYRYPYECAEQLSSRVLGIAALRDVLSAFEADGLPPPAALEKSVAKDMERLRNIQNGTGGFGFWNYRDEAWPYLTVHVTHALARAKQKGYAVPANMLARAQSYVANVERYIPSYYPPSARWTIIAYSVYVRKLLGDLDKAKATRLIASAGIDKLSMESLGWLLFTLGKDSGSRSSVASILRQLENRATETAGTATFATSMSDGGHLILHSSRRADAIILEALLEAKPKHDLVTKVMRGLLAHKKRGKWTNTQENVFVLLAMDRYFAEYEKVTPNFVARAWLGQQYAGDHAFRGRTTERYRIDVPMKMLAPTSEDLILQRDGAGRMYYRVGMRYAPRDLKLPPADHGFAVERTYEAVDDPGDVRRDADGTWVVKAGARVRVRVTMVAESRRYHVALVDNLPAGLEPLNPALKVTGALPTDPSATTNRYWWWARSWYEHQNMRDERVEAFASLLWAGVHEYSYVTAATTPGNFVAPPAKAEEMYAPETFGRSASDRLRVE